MSKGLGRVQRAILQAFANAEPMQCFTTDDLARIVYGVETIEKRHRVAVLRAIKDIVPHGWRQSHGRVDWTYGPLHSEGYKGCRWERKVDREARQQMFDENSIARGHGTIEEMNRENAAFVATFGFEPRKTTARPEVIEQLRQWLAAGKDVYSFYERVRVAFDAERKLSQHH